MGFGNMGNLITSLLDSCGENDRLICVCGRNGKMKKQLDRDFHSEERLLTTGFTDKVSILMDASDVLFSKPGGITSTEAVLKQLPLIHTAPIPGLESYNAHFFHYHNMSYSTRDPNIQAEIAIRLCQDEKYRSRMTDAQLRNSYPDCCEDIISMVSNLQK